MKKFKKIEVKDFEAAQYGKDESAKEFVKLCQINYGTVRVIPSDLLGTPTGAFNAVKTESGWAKISEGDWVVKRGDELLVVPDGVFKLLFAELTD